MAFQVLPDMGWRYIRSKTLTLGNSLRLHNKGIKTLNFDAKLDIALARLHDEGRYRTFIDIERKKGQYPHAIWTTPEGEEKDITVWCG
ncbi:MAG: hypothetical protein ACI94O_000861, partial [Octadecabacter sp.]